MILAATILAALCAPQNVSSDYTLNQILDAIRIVETGGRSDAGRGSNGDGGRALGPFQIHVEYWKDTGLPGKYDDCRDLSYSRSVVLAYWRRYCPEALAELNAEVLARTHNGGPAGAKRDSTLPFWKKVRLELERSARRDPGESAQANDDSVEGSGCTRSPH
jgi:hypothetical protein